MDTGNSRSPLDPAKLDALRRQGGDDHLVSMCESFLTSSVQRLDELGATSDPTVLSRISHNFKTSCRIVGALHLGELCEALEHATEGGEPPPPGAVQQLSDEFLQVSGEVEELLRKATARTGSGSAQGARGQDPAESVSKRKPHIALVEDNADSRLLMSTILKDGYVVDEYASGEQALDGIAQSPPDLVLLDVSLPGMDGVEILAHLREDAASRALPVVALTAHAMQGDRERFLASGFDDYIAKPLVDEQVLFDIIERLLRRSAS